MSTVMEKYKWLNWATTRELSEIFKVSPRRIQQVLVTLDNESLLVIGILVKEVNSTNPQSYPIYRRNDY